jgi:hypothetical protein
MDSQAPALDIAAEVIVPEGGWQPDGRLRFSLLRTRGQEKEDVRRGINDMSDRKAS